MSDFQSLIQKTLEISKRFPNKWDVKEHYIDLVEEVGELGNALLVDLGKKSEKRRRADLKDSFADILFELILFADESGVDLDKSLTQMLEELDQRLKKGDYENS